MSVPRVEVRGIRWVSLALRGVLVGAASPVAAQSPALRSAEALLGESGIEWVTVFAPHFRHHFERGSAAEPAADLLARRAAAARDRVLALLGEEVSPDFDLFYVATRERMEVLTGARPKALAVPAAGLAVFVYDGQTRAHFRHELTHLMAGHFWGDAARPARWINEGLAQHAEGTCLDYSLDDLAGAFSANGRWIEPAVLVQAFGTQPLLDATVLSGSLVGFLYREYGRARVAALWRHGLGRFETLFGRDFLAVADEWRRSLPDGTDTAAGIDWQRLARLGCG